MVNPDSIERMINKWKSIGKKQWLRAFFITLDRAQNPPIFSWNWASGALKAAQSFTCSGLKSLDRIGSEGEAIADVPQGPDERLDFRRHHCRRGCSG
jgi:hypothetical protein